MKKIIVWLAVMMYTLSGYAQNAPCLEFSE